jgi:uncharacterized paraquat-inducible protein A
LKPTRTEETAVRRLACPECHAPIGRVKRNHDARCTMCRADLARARRAREKDTADQ